MEALSTSRQGCSSGFLLNSAIRSGSLRAGRGAIISSCGSRRPKALSAVSRAPRCFSNWCSRVSALGVRRRCSPCQSAREARSRCCAGAGRPRPVRRRRIRRIPASPVASPARRLKMRADARQCARLPNGMGLPAARARRQPAVPVAHPGIFPAAPPGSASAAPRPTRIQKRAADGGRALRPPQAPGFPRLLPAARLIRTRASACCRPPVAPALPAAFASRSRLFRCRRSARVLPEHTRGSGNRGFAAGRRSGRSRGAAGEGDDPAWPRRCPAAEPADDQGAAVAARGPG